MSIEKYRRARELIAKAGGGDFAGPKPESLVASAEAALGSASRRATGSSCSTSAPGTSAASRCTGHRRQLRRCRVPDAIALTLEARRSGLDPRYVLIGTLGDGSHDCLDTGTPADRGGPGGPALVGVRGPGDLADSFGSTPAEVEDALSDGDPRHAR
jgi:hypothetical protein